MILILLNDHIMIDAFYAQYNAMLSNNDVVTSNFTAIWIHFNHTFDLYLLILHYNYYIRVINILQ